MAKFSWEAERGVLPSQWLEAHPNEGDILFSIRQAFYPDSKTATKFRARVGTKWLHNHRLLLVGKVQPSVRDEALRRFKRVEAEMHLHGIRIDELRGERK